MDEQTVCHVGHVTAPISLLIRSGLVRRTPEGNYLTTGADPRTPTEVAPPASPQGKPIDPYSLLGLQMRGYQVMTGKTPKDHRVLIDGGYYRIEAARENGLI